ncbi:AraC family transcriptional regulator [Paraflavitalea sp. CAU 1676]|uniref:AraC family transcriptional regulator n=1 Tax=Paraflavitalea sp. CAU 1676 TaxID=3032598 RepID=UPI0023DBD39F|nr:AraC family transcriptional regulator [Paraflavitalea sp. CAU 1676]MDF2187787.1 AraC family transcriptional regulator [Paraflavitalea sp. CAU 1676]
MELSPDIYERIVAAKLFMDQNFHEPISLDGISGQACFSRFHFHRLFSRIYRKTPHQYLTRKRLDKAQELLSQNIPVTDVCNEVGFESVGSFSTLFKKEVGIGPQHYRNMMIMKKQKAQVQPRTFIPHCFIEGYKLDK